MSLSTHDSLDASMVVSDSIQAENDKQKALCRNINVYRYQVGYSLKGGVRWLLEQSFKLTERLNNHPGLNQTEF